MRSAEAVVHLIDDDEAVRQALTFLLTSSGFAVKTYASAIVFLGAVTRLAPGCIVTDIRMPGMTGVELQKQLNFLKIGLPVIVMTGHGDVALAVAAMKLGAADFIEKPFHDDILILAIRLALQHAETGQAQHHEADAIQRRLHTLSAREGEVLEKLVLGKANKVIAYDLEISARTVEVHRANLMKKMAADNISALIRMVYLARAPG